MKPNAHKFMHANELHTRRNSNYYFKIASFAKRSFKLGLGSSKRLKNTWKGTTRKKNIRCTTFTMMIIYNH
jgi:hypothetical protein